MRMGMRVRTRGHVSTSVAHLGPVSWGGGEGRRRVSESVTCVFDDLYRASVG
jgi:hypothetical protein